MKKYYEFNAEHFASDQLFREWVLHPNAQVNLFWEMWIAQNPDKEQEVKQARMLLEALDERYKDYLTEQDIAKDIAHLTDNAKVNRENKRGFIVKNTWIWRVAACLLMTMGLTWLYFSVPKSYSVTEDDIAPAGQNAAMKTSTNHGAKEMTILLSDKSVATLMPGSSLTYPPTFTGGERRVNLVGEAFFDVAKDPLKPFLVYANETVTKVLGTSFRIQAFERDPNVTILVKTGLVSVYPLKEYKLLSDPSAREVAGVVLSPNQQVIFRKKESRLVKGIVANPDLLAVLSDNTDMIFDEKPIPEILHYLESVYGISIVFDEESLDSCVVSTQFNEENLKQRMSVICQAIGATYEIIDGQIIVNSKGCSP